LFSLPAHSSLLPFPRLTAHSHFPHTLPPHLKKIPPSPPPSLDQFNLMCYFAPFFLREPSGCCLWSFVSENTPSGRISPSSPFFLTGFFSYLFSSSSFMFPSPVVCSLHDPPDPSPPHPSFLPFLNIHNSLLYLLNPFLLLFPPPHTFPSRTRTVPPPSIFNITLWDTFLFYCFASCLSPGDVYHFVAPISSSLCQTFSKHFTLFGPHDPNFFSRHLFPSYSTPSR